MNFPPEVRHISENGPLTVVLWEQEVPGSNPGAPTWLSLLIVNYYGLRHETVIISGGR